MGKIAHQPMARNRSRDPGRNAPHHPRYAANGKEQRGPGQLLCYPGAHNESLKPFVDDPPLHNEYGWMSQPQFTMQLPESIAQNRGTVRKVRVTPGLALRPVADVVLADHPIRPS